MRSRLLAAAAFLLASSICSGQTALVADPRSGFGTQDLQVVTIPFSQFQSWDGDSTYFTACCTGTAGHRYPTAGVALLLTGIDAGMIPNGAHLESVDFFVRDADAGVNREFRGQLCRTWTDIDGTNPGGDCPVTVETSGAPADTVASVNPNLTVRYQFDVDNDGAEEVVSYMLFARWGVNGVQAFGPGIQLRQARLLFRRQVSPAPASATFNDVGVGHPYFQFIEALAASGITAGCGGGAYCPDAALTRGQMAVFLAKALGLHWPASTLPD
jgi:hypothetical protein